MLFYLGGCVKTQPFLIIQKPHSQLIVKGLTSSSVKGMLSASIFLAFNLILFVFWLFLLHFVRILDVFLIVCKYRVEFNDFVLLSG